MNAATRFSIGLLTAFALVGNAHAGDIRLETDKATKWKVYSIQQGNTVAKLVPDAGCNVMSLVVEGVEYFHQPKELAALPGVNSGNPILYPTPNRVKQSKFTFRQSMRICITNRRDWSIFLRNESG